MKEDNVKTLANFTSSDRANVVHAMLESMGIQSEVIHDMAVGVLTPMPNAVSIIVNERDYDRAKELLDAKFDTAEFLAETKHLL